MKRFVYDVAGFEFEDTVAFGQAWRDAKAFAKERGVAIYRTIIRNDEVGEWEVYCKSGCFLPVRMVERDSVAIF